MRQFAAFTLGILLLASVVRAQQRTVSITVDDLPFASGVPGPLTAASATKAVQVNRAILHAFTRHHVPATGFVIGQSAEQLGLPVSKKILAQWIRPGFDLGNHFYSHADVNDLSVEQIQQEITRGEDILSRRPRFLRFPYNHTGDTKEKHDAIAAFLAARGYQSAPCTIDSSDYKFNAAYVLAVAHHDERTAARVRAAYLAYTGTEIDWYTALDRQVFGYDPPHIMLLHDSPLNADTIEGILQLFRQRGYAFITLPEALNDKAYAVPETWVTKFGPMWGYRWAQELGVKVNGRDEPDPPAWIDQYLKN